MQITSMLAEHPFFRGLEPGYLELIAGCAREAEYGVGAYLFREGEPAAHFYIILQGQVMLETASAQRGPVVIESIEAGEVLGWSWLFPPYRWHFSARTVEPTRVVVLDGLCLRAKGEEDHDLGYELVKRVAAILIDRLQATRLQLLDMYNTPVRGGLW